MHHSVVTEGRCYSQRVSNGRSDFALSSDVLINEKSRVEVLEMLVQTLDLNAKLAYDGVETRLVSAVRDDERDGVGGVISMEVEALEDDLF